MRYRFRRSSLPQTPFLKRNGTKRLCLKGKSTLRVKKTVSGLPTKNYYAEDMGTFENGQESHGARRLSKALRRLAARIGARMRKEPRVSTQVLFRVLTALGALTLLIGATAVTIFFVGYSGPYKNIVIPDLISLSVEEASAVAPDLIECEIEYAKNFDMPQGVVIAQSPSAGITRRLYRKDGRLKIKLTVSTPRTTVTLPDPVGASVRDLSLTLKNAGVRVRIAEEYSSLYPSGTVISATKGAGTLLSEGDPITLIVSKGRQTVYATLPDLVGTSEREAVETLDRIGLRVGRISYAGSAEKLGLVISQSTAAGTKIPEGGSVDLVISGGIYYSDS
jgi:beta-lactam-binding protein with PASTA domain